MSKQWKHRSEMRGLFWTKILVGCMFPKTQVVAVVIILNVDNNDDDNNSCRWH